MKKIQFLYYDDNDNSFTSNKIDEMFINSINLGIRPNIGDNYWLDDDEKGLDEYCEIKNIFISSKENLFMQIIFKDLKID